MSIYTITLKRELLDDESPPPPSSPLQTQTQTPARVANGRRRPVAINDSQADDRSPVGVQRGETDANEREARDRGEANEFNLNEANWLDCVCSAAGEGRGSKQGEGGGPQDRTNDFALETSGEQDKENRQVGLACGSSAAVACESALAAGAGAAAANKDKSENNYRHSSDCLAARRQQLRELQLSASQVVHSVNVTLEVAADLSRANQVVWYKNQRQLTSNERPVFYAPARWQAQQVPASGAREHKRRADQQAAGGASRTIKRTRSRRVKSLRSDEGGRSFEEETTTEIEEEVKLIEDEGASREQQPAGGRRVCGGKLEQQQRGRQVGQLIEKCRQDTSERGSKLTIFDLQEEDYGQYTCRLIESKGNRTLEGAQEFGEAAGNRQTVEANQQQLQRRLQLTKLIAMDEVIEVKEGDLNIELGIQILPETNEDEELMSEQEKAEFIENTTISWFKDDVKLDQQDPAVLRLFQFTYDQVEGFHRLVVRRATKDTEGVYTCLVENESGTSSCSTQLVVGPGNKPKLTSQLQDVTVYVGQSLEFRIKSTGLPPIDSCQWFKDDELLIELASSAASDLQVESTKNERISMSRSEEWPAGGGRDEKDKMLIFRLCIDGLKLDDSGRYKCRINNQFGCDESDCYVKVLQEIIEEHEEIEETIEETLRLGGGGKRSTREEEEEQAVETVEEERRRTNEVKRPRQEQCDVAMGAGPRFRRKLEGRSLEVGREGAEETSEVTEEFIVSTVRDEHNNSRGQLKVRWLVDGRELAAASSRDARDESLGYEWDNFYESSEEEILHKLTVTSRSRVPKGGLRVLECQASNEFGEASTRAQVRWQRKPHFLRKLEDQETQVGETVTMRVTVEEEEGEQEQELASRDLRFLKDGKLIYSSRRDGLDSRQLEGSSAASKTRTRIRVFEETVEVVEEVETTSRYTARRYSRPVTQKRRGRSYELVLEDVQVNEQGTWECQATNETGQSACRAELEVFAEPRIVTDLSETARVQPHKEIRLTLEATGSPTPVFSWFKDGQGIAEEEDRVYTEGSARTGAGTTRRRSSVTAMSREDQHGLSISGETLIIRDARPEDAGLYRCKVENRLGQVESRASKLTVIGHGDDLKGAPKIIKDLSRDQLYQLDEGETLVLKVLAEGQPRPTQHWIKDEREEVTTSVEEVTSRETRVELDQVGQEHKLTIRRTRESDSGRYKVVLRNELGETESRTVEVRVSKLSGGQDERRPSAPTVQLDSQDKVVGVGSNVSFDVQVAGHPKPLITWFKNGRRMTESSDGRVSFVEEEETITTTTTTTTLDETDERELDRKSSQRKETTTVHKLVIRDVRESDEAIYSLKAENDLGCSKSSLVSLSVDKRKAATDELAGSESASEHRSQVVEEEEQQQQHETTTTTTTTTTSTTVTRTQEEQMEVEEEEEEEEEEVRRRKEKSSRTRQLEELEEEAEDELDESGQKKRKQITRITRTTKTTTTSTTEEQEEEDAVAEARRQRRTTEQEEDSTRKSKRRVVEEVEEDEEEEQEEEEEVEENEQQERTKRKVRKDDLQEQQVQEDRETGRRKVVQMEVDEQLDDESKRRKSKRRDSREASRTSKTRRESIEDEEEDEEEEEEVVEETTTRGKPRRGPRILSAPKEVIAGLGSRPELEVEVEEIVEETTTTTTRTRSSSARDDTKVTWLKDNQPIADRLTRDSHLEFIERPGDQPGAKKRVMRINSLRTSDEGEYVLEVEDASGRLARTEPIKVAVDRTMRPGQRPSITPADIVPQEEQRAPEVVSVPEEVVAGIGSSPQIEAEVEAIPKPQLTWFKDGQPITDELTQGHLEVVELPTDKPNAVKQALRINNMKPDDTAAYHVKAENPQGQVESEPTNVRVDRSMGPEDEPLVSGLAEESPSGAATSTGGPRRPNEEFAPTIVSAPDEIVAGPGSSPQIEAEVAGSPLPQLTWLKDGKPLTDRDLRAGHVEIVDLPSDRPECVKQALKINDLRPSDVADYQVRAENPLGQVESAPIELKLDRSKGPRDEPVVRGLESKQPEATQDLRGKPKQAGGQEAPSIVKMPDEIVAGPGSSPQIEAEVAGSPLPQLTWLKDGRPITDRDLRLGHVELVNLPSDKPDTIKQALKVNDLRPTDVADYQVRAENPLGQVDSEPTRLKLDRRMSLREQPVVRPADAAAVTPSENQKAPEIVSFPGEVAAGRGGSPLVEAEVSGLPKPELTWLKDGQPLSERDLRTGHVEIVDLPTDKPDTRRQALKINDLRPSDVAEYQVKAENPLGSVESQPTSVKIDRSLSSTDEPIVRGLDKPAAEELPEGAFEPAIVTAPEEVVAGRGGAPAIEAEVTGRPLPETTWFKDGQPLDEAELSSGHLELVELPTSKPDTRKQALKINELRPSDVAAYHVRAENPLGEAESEPTNVRIDRSMAADEQPQVTGLPEADQTSDLPERQSRDAEHEAAPREAPTIVSAPDEIVAGPGSSPQIEAEVAGSPLPQLTWLKDGKPLTDRDLRAGHVEIVDLPSDRPECVKQALKINDLRPSDVADYQVRAENPLGQVESAPIELKLDRSKGPRDEPVVIGLNSQPDTAQNLLGSEGAPQDQRTPSIVSMPREVVAGPGSSPQIVAEVEGQPRPQLIWLKDGQPIRERKLSQGHIEIVDLPTDKPGTIKQALKIHDLRPSDVADYQVRAESPLGRLDSEPVSLKLDRSMGALEEPKVDGVAPSEEVPMETEGDEAPRAPRRSSSAAKFAPEIVGSPREVVAGLGSSPKLEVEVRAAPKAQVEWLKDGQPIPARLLRDGHLEQREECGPGEGVTRHSLVVHDLRPSDVADYSLRAENPVGDAQSAPIPLKSDRSMSRDDQPKLAPTQAEDQAQDKVMLAPKIVSAPDEIVAGPGSSPQIEAEVAGSPLPQLTWLKDGKPLTDRDLRAGHVEIVDLPSDRPECVKQALKINDLQPTDAAAYQVRAENPAGVAESRPTRMRLDRSMSSQDEPQVFGLIQDEPEVCDDLQPHRRESSASGGRESPAGRMAPRIVSAPSEIAAGPGSSPQIEAEVTGRPKPEISWFKDGHPISERDLSDGHLEVVELPTSKPDTRKQALKINELRPSDVAAYHVRAENPLGEAESEPTNVRIDRSMSSLDEPVVGGLASQPEEAQQLPGSGAFGPTIVSAPEEVVAGRGGAPAIEAEVTGRPLPETTWFKDGQPLDEAELSSGHLELVELPTSKPDTRKQALKINELRPSDVAAYHVRAENPLGEAESEPTNVRIDRSMAADEQPQVTGPAAAPEEPVELPKVAQLARNIKCPLGSSPVLDVEVQGGQPDLVEWLKDGRPVRETPDGHIELESSPDHSHRLLISNFRPTDEGVYSLRATNAAGSVESGPIRVSVTEDAKTPASGQPSSQEFAPEFVNATEEVIAGPNSRPQLEVHVRASPEAELTWYKDGLPLTDKQLGVGHLALTVERSPYAPDALKYSLKVDRMKPSDAATYFVVAKNPLGSAESKPIQLKLERSLDSDEAPLVRRTVDEQPATGARPAQVGDFAPQILAAPEEVVAGVNSSPELEVAIKAHPAPQTSWFKDGRPLSEQELAGPHLEVVREQAPEDADLVRERLRINQLGPADVAAYHVRAENPLGEAESEPTNVRIDRSLGAQEAPQVTRHETPFSPEVAAQSNAAGQLEAPTIRRIPRKVVAPLGSHPVIEVQIAGSPKPEVVWLRDGRQVADQRGHLALTELPNGTYRLAISNLKAVDQGDFVVRAVNAAGEVQSAPIALVIDTQMSPRDRPKVIDSSEPAAEPAAEPATAPVRGFAPKVVRVSEAQAGVLHGQVRVQVEVCASPEAQVSWLVDGQQIPARAFDKNEGGNLRVSAERSPTEADTTIYTLEMDALKPSDAGAYQLEAENPFGQARSPSVVVRLQELGADEPEAEAAAKPKRKLRAPQIKRAPRQVVAQEGSSPVLEVEVSGEPVPQIVWFRDGKRIERSDAHFAFEDSPEEGKYRLVVKEVTRADEATYTAQATNELGTDESGPMELKVTPEPGGLAPQVVRLTDEVVAGAGSSPSLEVTIRAAPRAQAVWYHDGQPLDLDAPEVRAKFRVREEQTGADTTKYVLEIGGLRPPEVGAYHLRAENAHGSVESEPINVRIDREMDASEAPLAQLVEAAAQDDDSAGSQAPAAKRNIRAPTIKRMPRRIVAGAGSSPTIEVEICGEPRPQVVWFRNGRRLAEIKNRVEFAEVPAAGGESTVFKLRFTDVKMTDQAEYSLVATNEAGTVDSGAIELLVDRSLSSELEPLVLEASEIPAPTVVANADGPLEAPKIVGLDERVEARPGQTVKLEAEVFGNPKPDIKWLKDGDEVELNIVAELPDSNRHSLTLRNVNDLYDGVYSLEAKNEAGTATKEARVSIADQPGPEAQPAGAAFQPVQPAAAAKRKSLDEPHEKPFIKKGLKFSQVNQGRSIKFEVQIDGKYDELIWLKDGQQINLAQGPVSSPAPDDGDEGGDEDEDDKSTLVASDDEPDQLEDARAGAPAKPKRKFPPRILMRPRNVVAGPGSRVAFEVRFEGEPRPEVVWLKQGERLASGAQEGKVTIEEVGEDLVRLVIEDVQLEDVASYQAVLENAYGQERSVPVRLELDQLMPASDDLANYSTSDLDAGDEGRPLKRGRAPRILSRPRPVHAGRGSRIAFEVQVAGEPEPVVSWYRDGRIIRQTSDGHVTIEEYSKGCARLVLADIQDADVGQFHVVAENKLGSARSIPVALTIDEQAAGPADLVEEFEEISQVSEQTSRHTRGGRPPRVLLRPAHARAPAGGQVSLDALVVGHTRHSTLVWHKDGRRLQVDGERVRVEEAGEGHQRLVIDGLAAEDAGAYTVAAENDFGVSMSRPAARLEVNARLSGGAEAAASEQVLTCETTTTSEEQTFYEQFVAREGPSPRAAAPRRAPRFTLRPRNRKAPLGARVDLEVRVSGEPRPDVVWYKNGRRVHTTADGRVRVEEFSDGGGSKLVIEELEETDHGVYAAEATNEWGKARTDDVQLRVTRRTEVSERTEVRPRGSATVTTRTKRTSSHYTFAEERHGYATLTISDAQLDHDGDYKLVVRNRWGEASTQAPLVVIPRVESRSAASADRSTGAPDGPGGSLDGRDSRARRTPLDELEDYGHELDRSVGVFGSESRYQSGEDTYLLQLRDTEFPLRLRKYLRFGARQSPSLRSNLMDAHWGAGARVTVRERRKFREVMDEEIDDEKSGRDARPTPMRLQQEVGTCGYAAAQLESLRVEAAERVARRSAEPPAAGPAQRLDDADMMPPFFRVKLKDAVVEESGGRERGQQEAVFVCLAAGEPKPDYSWFRNDVIITPDASRLTVASLAGGGSELRIREPRLHDAGCFKCVAFNVHGNVTSRARLRVAGRPGRPEPPECSSATARELFLQWRPPRDQIYDSNAADILGYRLEMSRSSVGQHDDWRVLAADIGHEFFVVDDLAPATSYTFRVSARNKFGWGDSSYAAYVTTCREQEAAGLRLAVAHECRQRQYVSEVCDPHVLRHCEDDKHPRHLDYALEQSPVSAQAADWRQAYALQAEIARGRFSVISKGVARGPAADEPDARARQAVALKFVAAGQAQAAQAKNEFDILRSLQHEKVARLEAAYRHEDAFVFVLERLSGLDVLTYLASFAHYNEETVSRIIQQVMDAIEYLHFRGMCLLELQPDNVVMTNGRTTSLKLVDFSSARFVPRSGARVPQNATQTPEYCPPEVIAGHEVSTASDVWCIGVLTYVLLSGFSPFRGASEDETRENVRLGRYKYDRVYANCTPEVTRFLINVFKKHSSKRPTIEQLYENKWLLPNEFMIRKRQHATFSTDKIAAFAEEFHKQKQRQCADAAGAALEQLAERLAEA